MAKKTNVGKSSCSIWKRTSENPEKQKEAKKIRNLQKRKSERKKQERNAEESRQKCLRTAQQSIPYLRMFQDGICQVTKTFFSKTIQFYDINYQLALNEDKTTIFRELL